MNVPSGITTTSEQASKKRKINQLQSGGGGGPAEYLTWMYGASHAGQGSGACNYQGIIAAPQIADGNQGYSHIPHPLNSMYFNNNIGHGLNTQLQNSEV